MIMAIIANNVVLLVPVEKMILWLSHSCNVFVCKLYYAYLYKESWEMRTDWMYGWMDTCIFTCKEVILFLPVPVNDDDDEAADYEDRLAKFGDECILHVHILYKY